MGVSWTVDVNPSQVNDMPPKPELSSRGTIVNRDKDQVAHPYRDVQRYPAPFLNSSSHRAGEGINSRDPRISHYQSGLRDSTRGSHPGQSSPAGGHYPPPPPIQYPSSSRQPEYYSSKPTPYTSRTTSSIPQTQLSRQDEGNVSTKSTEVSSGHDNDRHNIAHRNNDQPRISSRELPRESPREPQKDSSTEPSAAQVTKWVRVVHKDAVPITNFLCVKNGMLKSGPTTVREYKKFAQAIENNRIDWDAPNVLAIDFVYDAPAFPLPSASTLQKSATHPPPAPPSGNEQQSRKKPRTKRTSTENDTSSNKHSSHERSNDHQSTKKSKIEPSSELSTSSNGNANGNNDVHVARLSTKVSAEVAAPPKDLMQVAVHRKIKNTITVINAILNQDDYCYMPYRAFEKSYDRLRVNMSPAMTGAELSHALQSDLQTEVSSHVVLTMYPGNPLARYIRLRGRDIKHRRSREDDHVEVFRKRFLSEADRIVFPGTIISIHALVYLMESLRPDPLSDAAVRQRLGQVDLYDFLTTSSTFWEAHHMGHSDRELVSFNPPIAEGEKQV